MYIHKQIICTVPALGPSEPGKALMEVNELFLASPPPPRPVFISLRLFWSSGVISKTKCLSAHKGRWLICFNASICQASCLLLHSVWKESLASQLAFQDLQAFQHLRQERPTVRLRVCSHLFMHVCACLNTFLLEGWVPSLLVYISPLRSSMCSLKRLKKTENFLLPADMIHPVGLL